MNREVENLFHQVVELSPPERQIYFEANRVDAELRHEVELLLQFDDHETDTLSQSVAILTKEWVGEKEPPEPERCGPYRLLRALGRGGMGTVYLAERADGEIEQRVAIKFLHPGGHAMRFQDRFLRERQILATLHHPGIARLIDVGHTLEGRPFLVMDYIDGTPIDAYAEKLDLREKLALFLRVCDAVSYAHGNLVVHRDLKPSNILVDTSGNPKLLDFGIAKIMDDSLDQTQTQERLLTPEYASPEQIRGGAQNTATDIYSLGAILYKLVAGRSPHLAPGETREQLMLAVCDAEATPLSSLANVPRDLDFIAAKALRKEPGERYRSVDSLADDVRAFLQFRPVRARSGNAWYRMRKFTRRYWIPVTAAVLVVASLSAGLYLANRERAIAQRRFTQVRRLANKVLALDEVIRALPGSTQARQEVVAMSQEYLAGLSADVRSDQDLALEVARAYLLLARAQGVPTAANLGQYAQAEESLKKAEALLDSVLRRSPHNATALVTAAAVAQGRMILADTDHRHKDTRDQARKTAEYAEAFLATGQRSPDDFNKAAALLTNVALAEKNLHLYEDSIRDARRAIQVAGTYRETRVSAAAAYSVLADSLRFSGNLDGALQAIREARGGVEQVEFAGEALRRAEISSVLWREGAILGAADTINLNRPGDAIPVLQRAFDLSAEWAEKDPKEITGRINAANAARLLGRILADRDPAASLVIYNRVLRLLNGFETAKTTREKAELLAGSSIALLRVDRGREGQARLDQAFDLLRQTKDYPAKQAGPDGEAAEVLGFFAAFLTASGQMERAAQVYEELLTLIMASNPDPENDLPNAARISLIYQHLADVDRRLHRSYQATALDARRAELWKLWQNKLPQNPFVLHQAASR
ncbi:MAG: serine/threonine protein kinase [Acidobacteriia bacterium]|nr:serine/threonine protein kinase [Terriglobia bacterium]